ALFKSKRHEFIQPPIRKRFKTRKENCDLFLKLIDTYTNKLCGMALIENRDLDEMLAALEFSIHQRRELLNNSPHIAKQAQTNEPTGNKCSEGGHEFVHRKTDGFPDQSVHIEEESCMDKPVVTADPGERESHPPDSPHAARPRDLVNSPLDAVSGQAD